MKAIVVFLAILGVGLAKPAPRDLAGDLQDFLDVIPFDDILDILNKHLETDGALADVVLYLQGDDWQNLVDEVGDKQAVQDFIAYLTDAGIPVDDIIAAINKFIQTLVPGVEPDDKGSLTDFLDEVVAVLPLDKLLSLLNDKLQNSPDFQNLYVEISSEDARELVEEVRQIDEVQRIAQKLRDFGVPIDEILAAVYEFFGWGKP